MRKLLLLSILGFCGVAESVLAQPQLAWDHNYGGAAHDECNQVIQTTDGGYAMGGRTVSYGAGNADFWLVRTNSVGAVLWTRTYGGGDNDVCHTIIQTSDGGFALAGSTISYGAGNMDMWLVKTDANGDLVWSQTYGGNFYDYCNSLIQTTDGGYALGGFTNSYGAGGGDFWLVKTDANGNSSWTRTFGTEAYDICSSLIQTSDGGYALGGWNDSAGNYDIYLVKTDANGDNPWVRTFGGNTSEVTKTVIQTADGGYALSGCFNNSTTTFLVKADGNGDNPWYRSFNGMWSYSMIQTTNGGYAMGGHNSDFRASLILTDGGGDNPVISSLGAQNASQQCNSLIQAADGNFVLAGFYVTIPGSYWDFWLAKTEGAFDGYNDFIQTQDEQSIVVTAATFDNQPVPTGWEVGVFTPAGVLSGGGIWQNGQALGVAAFGDDDQTQDVEGFVAGEVMNFRLWDNNANVEYPAVAIVSQGDLIWQNGDATALSLQGYLIYTMDLVLEANWNIISVNVVPSDLNLYAGDPGPEIIPMMAQFGNNLLLMKDEDGRFYWPALNFNNIPYWNLAEGYKVKVSQQQQGSWTGAQIPASSNVPIETGWNIIAYFPTYELHTGQGMQNPDFYVVSSVVNNVLMAKNSQGDFMLPHNNPPFTNMPVWRESQGYQIKVNAPVVLNYPQNEPGTNSEEPPVEFGNGHWTKPAVTGINMSVLVTSITGLVTQAGDQIAAFNAAGNIVGVGSIEVDGKSGIAVWGDDASTEAVDGLQNGEAFTLRLWSSGKETEFSLETILDKGSLVYETDGFANLSAIVSVSIPSNFYISESYPNPFNSTTRIAFGLPEAGHLNISVYDMAGRLVAALAEGEFVAGNHTAVWNADAVPAGLYMVKMQAGNFSDVRKLTLVK